MKKRLILSTALVLALGALPILEASSAFAQAPQATEAQTPPAQPQGAPPAAGPAHPGPAGRQGPMRPGPRRAPDFAARAAARIAYIKTALKITPAQESAFDKYAQTIQQNAQRMQQAFTEMRAHRGQPQNALDRVEQRARFAQMRDQAEQQYLAAFRPLYDSLSPDQKKTADALATPQGGRFGHFHGRDMRRG